MPLEIKGVKAICCADDEDSLDVELRPNNSGEEVCFRFHNPVADRDRTIYLPFGDALIFLEDALRRVRAGKDAT